MQRKNKFTLALIIFSLIFIAAELWLFNEINNLKVQNMKLELLLLSDRQDYSQSFVIFNRLIDSGENITPGDSNDDHRLLFEAQYESVILNSDYNAFPDFDKDESPVKRLVRAIDKKLNPSFYKMIDERRVNSEKFMELAYFMEINKNYERAIRYYTLFLDRNENREHDYYNIAALHLAFSYLMYGYFDNCYTLANEIKKNSANSVLQASADRLLKYIESVKQSGNYKILTSLTSVPLELGLRHYLFLDYRHAIDYFTKYFLKNKSKNKFDLFKAIYFTARSYEELGQYIKALEFYYKIIESGEKNPYRIKTAKRLLILHFIYKIKVKDIESIISSDENHVGKNLVRELEEMSLIGEKLLYRREMIEKEIKRVDDELQSLSGKGEDSKGLIDRYFDAFNEDITNIKKKDLELINELEEIFTITKKMPDKNGTNTVVNAPARTVKLYLKDNSEIVGKLIKRGEESLKISVFGKIIDIKKDDIKKWEYIR